MSHNPQDNHIDWNEFEKMFFSGGEDSDHPVYEVDQVTEFDEKFKNMLNEMAAYCQSKNIAYVMGITLLRSENEEADARVRTVAKTMMSIPEDTQATICELQAMSAILKLPHEFSHMVLQMAFAWYTMGARRGDDDEELNNNTDDEDNDDA